MSLLRPIIILLSATILGCSPGAAIRSPGSPWYAPPAGSRVILEKPVTIPPDTVSVHIQNGEVVSAGAFGGVDRYRASCKLEMWSRVDERRVIEPDTFVVKRVARTIEAVQLSAPLRVASLLPMVFELDYSGPMAHIMGTEMFLDSERQPDVHRLTCSYWGEPAFPEHLSIEQIRHTLAGLMRIELPNGR